MALFRKLAGSIAPMFRKIPGEVSVLGRKISNTAGQVERGIARAEDVLGKVDRAIPNPLTKTIKSGLDIAKDISGGVGLAGGALRKGAEGDVQGAASLGKQAIAKGSQALGALQQGAQEVGKVAMFL